MMARLTVHLSAILLLVLVASATQAQTSRAASASAYIDRGNEGMAKGEWERAAADYDLAIAFDPSSIASGSGALVSERTAALGASFRDYVRAINLTPRYANAYPNRGVIHGKCGEHDAAIRDFSRVIEINPRDTRAWHNRSKTLT